MLGLIGTLYMGARSMQVQKQGIEVAGHNLANVSNPAYSRQRVRIEAAVTMLSDLGPPGVGIAAITVTASNVDLGLANHTLDGGGSCSGSLTKQCRFEPSSSSHSSPLGSCDRSARMVPANLWF